MMVTEIVTGTGRYKVLEPVMGRMENSSRLRSDQTAIAVAGLQTREMTLTSQWR